jgi:hypothetical protein
VPDLQLEGFPELPDGDETVTLSVDRETGVAGWWPESYKRLDGHVQSMLTSLREAVEYRRALESQIDEFVLDLRGHSISWTLIGFGVGTSAEAARQRWAGQERDDMIRDVAARKARP